MYHLKQEVLFLVMFLKVRPGLMLSLWPTFSQPPGGVPLPLSWLVGYPAGPPPDLHFPGFGFYADPRFPLVIAERTAAAPELR